MEFNSFGNKKFHLKKFKKSLKDLYLKSYYLVTSKVAHNLFSILSIVIVQERHRFN